MTKIKETWQIDNDTRERAFLLQFEGEENEVIEKFGLKSYSNPVITMKFTGLFGILDALMDLGLTNREIMDFYIHDHVEPYDDPYRFTEGIIKIVWGMSKNEIKNKYGRYFEDETVEKISNPNRNTQMLLSFCYSKNDIYEFIPNEQDLIERFSLNYSNRYSDCYDYVIEKNFQKIEGKLFRAVRFLVREGYDFPNLQCLLNEQIKDIEFKQTKGENIFILNKEYACKMSDNILSLVCFLKRIGFKILNPEDMFDQDCDNINLIDSNGKKIILSLSYLEEDVNKYYDIIKDFNRHGFQISQIINLCDKRVENISFKFVDNKMIEHNVIIERNMLDASSEELLKIMKKTYNQGFTFTNINNLFDINQKMLKVIDSRGKEYSVAREQFNNMLEIIIQCSQNGYSFSDYSNVFDENKPYIACFDEKNKERILSRKQLYKIIKLQELSYWEEKDLTDSEKDLLAIINNYSLRKKLFEWLPYTVKKWIPSSAVISKIPAERSYEYFYNNNHTRLKILKDEYNSSSYDEMEGIISLGYILGLFDSKESTSEKALNYIINHFLKKGITADELHTTYGAIDLRKGYNKKFADFFMKHYTIDNGAFIEPDLGTNMVGELFERFDEILESRPEKRIKTRTINKLLTPIDAMASITNIKIDREILGKKANDKRYIHLVELLMKFGASNDELKWAIELYEQALAIDEQKVNIPYIEDLKPSLMKFTSHLKSDPQAFLSGRKTNCCSRYGGHAQDRLTHVITDPNWRYVTFTSSNRTFFDGLVWYDKEEQVVCIDNVEGQFSKIDKNNGKSIAIMADTVIRYADGIYHKMNALNIPCIKVNVGKDPETASWEIFKYASQQKLINEDNNPCNYPTRNSISTDAYNQFTITDEKILRLRGTH